MKTQYYAATSLDGFIATENDSLDWLFPLGDLNSSSYPAFIADVGALAMGSATYEWMVRNAESLPPRPARHGRTRSQPGYSPVAGFQSSMGQTSDSSMEKYATSTLKCKRLQAPKHLDSWRRGSRGPVLRCWLTGRTDHPGGFGHPRQGQATFPSQTAQPNSAPDVSSSDGGWHG